MTKRARPRVRRDFEISSGNVYADVAHVDAESMLVKAKLVSRIAELLHERELTQTAAAQLLGVPQPKLSNLLRGHFHGISERKLMDFLRASAATWKSWSAPARARDDEARSR